MIENPFDNGPDRARHWVLFFPDLDHWAVRL